PLEVQTNGETMAASLSYHIAVAVKDPTAKGNSSGSRDKDAIEKTASQVCMGANGLIELTANTKKMVNFRKSFIPVIFTTARLFASDCNLTTTDLSTGEIDLANSNIEEKHWLLYHYHLTPGIKHSVESRQSSKDLAAILDFNYIRTIPVVNANHIAEFLNFLKPDTF
ncbi:hypothetical protein KAR91_60635, partial [Candidatus Pacearchaeota archaeon]|nr:hypothetical protein [Candidatus Pacearchaeota archaeon]